MSQQSTKRIVGVFDALCLIAILAILMIPALAATTIPIVGTSYTVNFGDAPAWILSIAAVVNVWMVWSLHHKAGLIHKDTELIHKETNSMRAALELAAQAKGKLEGEQMAHEALGVAKEAARKDSVADAEAAAKVRAAESDKG